MVQPAGALWRGVLHSRMTMMAMAMRIQYVMRRTAGSEPEFVDGGVMGAAAGTWEEGVGLAGRTGAALPVCCWGGGDGFTLAGGGEVSPAQEHETTHALLIHLITSTVQKEHEI
jgi:hypothetical protein